MIKYDGRPDRTVTVTEADGSIYELKPRPDLVNYTPVGFGWGDGGDGPAQLALAILAHHTGDNAMARRHHRAFINVLGMIRDDYWTLTDAALAGWLDAEINKPPRAPATGQTILCPPRPARLIGESSPGWLRASERLSPREHHRQLLERILPAKSPKIGEVEDSDTFTARYSRGEAQELDIPQKSKSKLVKRASIQARAKE